MPENSPQRPGRSWFSRHGWLKNVTLIAGEGATAELGETLRAHVAGAWPFVEVQCYEGGQPHYPLLVGVE